MKKIYLCFFCIAVLLSGGCVTSTVKPVVEYEKNTRFTEKGNMVVADLEATNYTSYLFGIFPIVGGSHTLPNAWQYHMWKDTVSDRKTKSMMNWYARRVMKCDGIENYKVERDTIGWPTLWIVSWRTVHATAQAVKNTALAGK